MLQSSSSDNRFASAINQLTSHSGRIPRVYLRKVKQLVSNWQGMETTDERLMTAYNDALGCIETINEIGRDKRIDNEDRRDWAKYLRTILKRADEVLDTEPHVGTRIVLDGGTARKSLARKRSPQKIVNTKPKRKTRKKKIA